MEIPRAQMVPDRYGPHMHVTVTLHGSPMCLRRGSDPHQGPVPHDRLGHGAVEPHRLGARFFWTNFAMSESFTCALPFPRNLARGTISSRIEVCFRLATGVDFSTRLSTWGIVLELKLPVNGELCTNMILTQQKAPKAALCSTPAVSDLECRNDQSGTRRLQRPHSYTGRSPKAGQIHCDGTGGAAVTAGPETQGASHLPSRLLLSERTV